MYSVHIFTVYIKTCSTYIHAFLYPLLFQSIDYITEMLYVIEPSQGLQRRTFNQTGKLPLPPQHQMLHVRTHSKIPPPPSR